MANATIKITQLPSIGNGLSASTILPVVNTTGTATTDKVAVGNIANFTLLQAGNTLPPAFVSTIAYSVANAAQPNITSVGTLTGLTVTGTTVLPDVSDVSIQGGTNGYVLQTDGAGNLSWTAQTGGGGGNGSPGGSNTQIQFNDAGSFGGNTGFTFNKTAGALAVAKVDTAEVYHLNGVVVENADLTHGATAALVLPSNGNTTVPAQVTNTYGNVQITTGVNSGSLKNFIFDNTGNLTTPGNISVAGNANIGNIGTAGTVTATGNVGGGNINSAGNVSATGNVIGGNIVTNGLVTATGTIRGGTLYATGTGTAVNASSGNILTNQVTGTKFNFLNGLYTATITGSGATGNYSLNLPADAGMDGQVLTTDGTGNLSWSAGGSGNTGNVTFDNVAVQGVSGFGLQLSPSPDDTANLKYLQVRAGDVDSHIHFDTGDNTSYDQYFGDDNKYVQVSSTGNIIMSSYDGTNAHPMVLDTSGNLVVPGSITSSLSGGFPFGGAITYITTGDPTVIVTLDSSPFSDAVTGRVTITGVTGATQANGTRYYRAVEVNAFQLFNDAACTIPTSGTDWTAYTTGGFAYSPEYNDLELKGDTVDIRTGDSIFHFTPTGDIQMPGGAYASGGYGRLLTNNGYTTLLSYGSDPEHGGPELDWSDASDVGNVFDNSDVLRNTLFLNDGGLYVGLNQNNNANAVNASLRFDRYGALIIPAGSANTTSTGQILSNNESGFINLDVQFDIEPGSEGGVRLGTTASKPVDIWASSSQRWRFDSDGSFTVPGVIKSIGSFAYRGFYAVLNQISGDDPSINQIVLSRSSDISGSNPTTDTDDDNFIVTGIDGSNITAIVNLYGTSTSTPLDTESIFYFIRNYIDVVLYNGDTQRTSISDIQTAFATNEVSLLEENFAPGTIVDNMNFNGIQAIFQVNSFTHTGSGTDAVFFFDLDDPIGAIDYNTAEWNSADCVVPGTGYQVGDTITVPGTELGGAAPADNMTITVGAINGSGGITDFSVTGTMSQASYEQNFVKRYIYDGTSDIQDQGNFLGTDVSRCVFTAYTDADSNLIVTSVDSGGLYPFMTFYEPTNQTYPMVMWQTDGATEGGTGTYVTGGYDTIGSNLPSTTYTAYGMYYGVGETVTGNGENWGAGTYGTMVGSNGNGIFSMVCLDGTASIVSYAGNTGSDGDGTKAAISQFAIGAIPEALNLVSSNNTWSFGTDGNLTVPGNINAVATGGFALNDTISNITTGSTTVVVTLNSTTFPGPVTGKVAISGVLGTVEANQTWWFQAVEVNEIQLYTDSEFTTPANGTTWLPYIGGGSIVSVTYDNLVVGAGVLTLGNPNRQWTIYDDGNIVATHSTASIIGGNGLAVEAGAGSKLTNVINVPVDQTFTGAWNTATYSDNSGTGRIDIVGAYSSLRRFVQLYMQYANTGTAVLTINDSSTELIYNGFEYNGDTFTIYVVQSPGDSVTVTTMTLYAVMRNVMELDDDGNQLNLQSFSGWPVNITSGYQGDVRINAGDDIVLNAGDKTTSDNTGGQIDINAGNGGSADTQDPAGNGGDININGGQGGYASNIYGAGNGGTVYITGAPGGSANAGGEQNAGNGGSVVLQAGNAGDNASDINLGREGGNVVITAGYTTGSYVGGGVVITAGTGGVDYGSGNITLNTQASDHTTNYTWSYNNDGSMLFPVLTVNLHNGGSQTARTLQFGDIDYQAVITGPTPPSGYNAQRLIIQGQAGQSGGEGGDVYVWAGDSDVNGGDIKIYAGDADGGSGYGGYINITGGQGFDGGGDVSITGGRSTNSAGAEVRLIGGIGATTGGTANVQGGQGSVAGGIAELKGGYGGGSGGNVNITGGGAGNGLAEYGNVNINAGASSWVFGNDGNLTAPGSIVTSTGTGGNISGANVITANVFSATGNVTGNYFIGNGSQLTGIVATSSYGDSNVATFLAAYGSNTVSTTGNISSGNLIASANVLGNGYARFTGAFDESQASTAGLYLGYAGGTPRIMFGTGTTAQTLEIDNDGGTLRFYKPGTTLANLNTSGDFATAGNITATGKIGYSSGGTVTQTGTGQGVTLNQLTGQITLAKSSWTANDLEAFVVQCNKVSADDYILAQISGTYSTYFMVSAYYFTGTSFYINVRALDTISSAPVVKFFIMKAPTS
jgi:hypothetical protein